MIDYPIFFVHKGHSNYLTSVLEQARETNPHRSIILIGDTPTLVPDGVSFANLDEYSALARDFQRAYYAITDQPVEFEMFCFKRWFILLEYTTRHNIAQFYTSDSDVLLFCDLDERLPDFVECDFALSAGHSPHCMFFNHPLALKSFCEQIIRIFAVDRDKTLASIKTEWELEKLGVVGVTMALNDMRSAKGIAERTEWLVKDIRQIIHGRRFDHAVTCPEGFEFSNNRKVLQWKRGIPYCFHQRLGIEVRFDSLHFHSGSKDVLETAVAYFREGFTGVL